MHKYLLKLFFVMFLSSLTMARAMAVCTDTTPGLDGYYDPNGKQFTCSSSTSSDTQDVSALVPGQSSLSISRGAGGYSTILLNNYAGTFNVGSGFTLSNNDDAFAIRILNDSVTTRAIVNEGIITSLAPNAGVINIWAGHLDSLINTGVIEKTYSGYATLWIDKASIYNGNNLGSIGTLTNTGLMVGAPIYNTGSIAVLNNLQGKLGDVPLLFSAYSSPGWSLSNLPGQYNVIVNSPTQYGQLAITNTVNVDVVTGRMAFNIYGNTGTTPVAGVSASVLNAGTYTGVLQGFTNLNNVDGTSGRYGNFSYSLVQQTGTDIWDLLVSMSGPSAADTQASLSNQARRLRSTFNSTMASGNFANMNTYDCNLFDKNNMCISAGGRYTNIDNPSSNNSAAVVVLGYKVNSNIRIGGFLDQSINNNSPTGINVSNKNPMMGAFAVWNKNADGLGYQVKIANAYQDKDVRSTRDAFGETGEAGTGKTNLNTQSYVGELSYAFNYQDSTIVRPYFALRYTNIKQDAYTETGVSTPLSYGKLGDRSTTALMGVKLNHALNPRTNLTASLGLEQDLHHKTDQLVASGVADLTSENFNNRIKRTRPVASAGAYYAVTQTQRLSGEVYYQQLPFQSTGSATAYVNYMIGF